MHEVIVASTKWPSNHEKSQANVQEGTSMAKKNEDLDGLQLVKWWHYPWSLPAPVWRFRTRLLLPTRSSLLSRARLDYQPLSGKGARAPPPNSLFSARVDQTRESDGNRAYAVPRVHGMIKMDVTCKHEPKTQRNAFAYLSKHASVNLYCFKRFYAFLKGFEIFDPLKFFPLLRYSV